MFVKNALVRRTQYSYYIDVVDARVHTHLRSHTLGRELPVEPPKRLLEVVVRLNDRTAGRPAVVLVPNEHRRRHLAAAAVRHVPESVNGEGDVRTHTHALQVRWGGLSRVHLNNRLMIFEWE